MSIGRITEQSATRRLILDDVRVTYVSDGAMQLTTDGFFPDVPTDHWTAETLARPGRVAAPVGGVLVERQGRRLLIDVGMGGNQLDEHIGVTNCGALLETLSELGHRPDDIDVVVFTHLHTDHTGWGFVRDDTGMLRQTFPAARYLVVGQEWGPYQRDEIGVGAPPRTEFIEPLARVLTLIDDGAEVFPGVRALVTPGHSPGHCSYLVVGRDGRRLLVFGDVFHLPGQITHPEWPSGPDLDHEGVRAARRRILAELEEPNTIGFGFHFGDQPFGRVTRDHNGARHWQPIDTEALSPAPRQIA